jgi:hypothetical protein
MHGHPQPLLPMSALRKNSRRWGWAACGVLAAWFAAPGYGRDYFLSLTGRDHDSGSRETPWRSLAKANHSLEAGDVLTVLDGSYPGTIEPASSGTADAPIIYRAATPFGAVLIGDDAKDSVCVRLQQREHIVIEGFQLRPSHGDLLRLRQARHCTIKKLRLEGGSSFSAILCEDSHFNRYEDLECGNVLTTGGSGHVVGDCWANRGSSHNVFLRVHFYRVGHCPLNFWNDSPYNIVRACTFDSQWGRNFEFFSTPHVLVEDCVITNGFDGSGSADGRAKLFIVESIFRRNIIFRNHYGPLVVNAYQVAGTPMFRMDHSRIYQNTWCHNDENGFEMVAEDTALVEGARPRLIDNVFKNNLFADNDLGGDGIALALDPVVAAQTRFVRNNLHGRTRGGLTVRYDVAHPDWANLGVDGLHGQSLTTDEANVSNPSTFQDNQDADPLFVDVDHDDYRLRPESACRDAGAPLAVATSSGKGRVMAIDDARWFFDGFGIPGEAGDLVFVGQSKQVARVMQADVVRSQLTLDRDVMWDKGDGVSLPYAGKAPDLGAYESASEFESWYRAPQIRPGLRLGTMATAIRCLVRTDFEPDDRLDWFYLWNFTRQKNTNAQLDSATSADGGRSFKVFATAAGATLACDIKPREWDIDRFPTVTFDYRIPPGTPVGIWLYAFKGVPVGQGVVCVGGTRARFPGPYRDLARFDLIDDDRWHRVTMDARVIRDVFPGVKRLQRFRFQTDGNGRAGDCFWFDRFSIQPATPGAP